MKFLRSIPQACVVRKGTFGSTHLVDMALAAAGMGLLQELPKVRPPLRAAAAATDSRELPKAAHTAIDVHVRTFRTAHAALPWGSAPRCRRRAIL